MATQIVTINGKRGEYTGFSLVDGIKVHYFSMYDGSVVRRADGGQMPSIIPFESIALGGQFNYGCITR